MLGWDLPYQHLPPNCDPKFATSNSLVTPFILLPITVFVLRVDIDI